MPRTINSYNSLIFNGFYKKKDFEPIGLMALYWLSYAIVGLRIAKLPWVSAFLIHRFQFRTHLGSLQRSPSLALSRARPTRRRILMITGSNHAYLFKKLGC
jgi:hypothetical protein